jgi:hypothetical protein
MKVSGENTHKEAISEALATLGASEREAEIYWWLVTTPGISPREIAQRSNQSRGRIYDVLRQMAQKGIVREEPTRPTRFVPSPIPFLLELALAETDRRRAAMLAAPVRSLSAPAGLLAGGAQPPAQFSLVKGGGATTRELSDLFDTASRHAFVAGDQGLGLRILSNARLWRTIRNARLRGVDCRILLPQGSESAETATRIGLNTLGAEVYLVAGTRPLPATVAVNDRIALLVGGRDENALVGDDVGLRIEHQVLVELIRRQFAAAFAHPAPAAPDSSSIPLEFMELLSDRCDDVCVMAPTGWAQLLGATAAPFARQLQQAKARGCRVRAIGDAGSASDAGALLTSVWEIRPAPAVPFWAALVERRFLFQAFPPPAASGPPVFRRSDEPAEVAHYQSLFDRLWGDASAALEVPQMSGAR